jgi:flagellar capping protein FliD
MADQIDKFVAGEQGFVEKLNKLVDQLNKVTKEIEALNEALDGKADKRKASASK